MPFTISSGLAVLVGPSTGRLIHRTPISADNQIASLLVKAGYWQDTVGLIFRANQPYFPTTYYRVGVYDDGAGNRCLEYVKRVSGADVVIATYNPSLGGDGGADWTLTVYFNGGAPRVHINGAYVYTFGADTTYTSGQYVGVWGEALAGQELRVDDFSALVYAAPTWTLTVDSAVA